MRKIILGLGFGLLGLWGIFGALWAFTSNNNPIVGLDITLQVAAVASHPYFPMVMIVFVVIMMLAAFSPLISGFINNSKKRKRLMQIGQKTMAKIVSIQDTGIKVNNNPYVKITVEIKTGMLATIETTVSIFNLPQVGNSLEVLYDPANPSEAALSR